jgi:predicted nucleic acid-binding protein
MDEWKGRNHHETGRQLTMPDQLNLEWNDMNVTVHIPDDLAERIGTGVDLSRRALEALALEEYRSVIAARRKGLAVIGTLGVLDLAAERGLLNLGEAFDRLKRTNFRCRQGVMDHLLDKASRKA